MIDNNIFQNIITNIKRKNLKVENLMITWHDKTYSYFFVPEKLTNLRSVSKMVTGISLGDCI